MMTRTATISRAFVLLLLFVATANTNAQNNSTSDASNSNNPNDKICNICGPGNYIGDNGAVVNFLYENTTRKFPCGQLQDIVEDPTIISTAFCKTQLFNYTRDVCSCADKNGNKLSDLFSTQAPTNPDGPNKGKNNGTGTSTNGQSNNGNSTKNNSSGREMVSNVSYAVLVMSALATVLAAIFI